jgi:hypothetical protein
MKKIIAICLFALALNNTYSQEQAQANEYPNALRFQFLGPIKGVLGLEYERFFGKQFAFVGEASYLGFNESRNISERVTGGLVGVGIKVYGPNYAITSRQKKNQSISSGFYGIGRVTFESFEAENDYLSYNGFIEPVQERTIVFNKSAGTVMLGGGFNLHILKHVTLDTGLTLGYLVLEDQTITSNPDNIFTNGTSRIHHGERIGLDTSFVTRLWVNIGVNF